ncbi:esterase E4-like [Periplaneta americana]|uniref:esterase E4-like n=1 Tax=Periplaneta americana TaxID=6978 RepID=UPI0037E9C66B
MLRPQVVCLLLVAAVLAEDIVVLKDGKIRGHELVSRKGRKIFAFQGIPYAKPPVGDLRFRRCQPIEPWTGVLDATQDAPMCLQRGLFTPEAPLSGQEDCLYLNVYTPQLPDGSSSFVPFDVMFWIHGGGWFSGSGRSDIYGPQYLLDKDVILVTINYRLGPLGFLSTGDTVCPGNNGLKDQVAALRWVQDNIAAFGGNPNSVTIFGESAGGGSVHYHMLSPLSKGLFHRGISQSGNTLCPWAHAPNGTTRYMAEKLATFLDCPTQTSKDMISCLKTKDASDIVNQDHKYTEWNIDPMIPFKPVVETDVEEGDEAFLREKPVDILLSSDSLDLVPWMVGLNSADGAIMASTVYGTQGLVEELNRKFDELVPMIMFFRESAPREDLKSIAGRIRKFYFGDQPISNNTVKELQQMYTDVFFTYGSHIAAQLHSSRSATVYYYLFDYRGTNSFSVHFGDKTRDYGVCHLDDLMYLFPQDHFFPGSEKQSEDDEMIDTLITLWTNFARTGDPTPGNDKKNKWLPVSSPNVLEYARIKNDGLKMEAGLYKERANFWTSMPFTSRIKSGKDEL